jgi:hypothetical protein
MASLIACSVKRPRVSQVSVCRKVIVPMPSTAPLIRDRKSEMEVRPTHICTEGASPSWWTTPASESLLRSGAVAVLPSRAASTSDYPSRLDPLSPRLAWCFWSSRWCYPFSPLLEHADSFLYSSKGCGAPACWMLRALYHVSMRTWLGFELGTYLDRSFPGQGLSSVPWPHCCPSIRPYHLQMKRLLR